MRVIRMNEFAGESDELVRQQVASFERVLRSGWWILGKEVSAFETEWAGWLGASHAVGCGNGLDAIEIGLRALDIGPGDEVITTPMTAFATTLAVIRAGAVPVLADIDSDTAMLDVDSVRRCISSRTKAILFVHLYGQVGPVDELATLGREFGLHLIEDCAQAHGAKLHGRSAGSFGALAAWSFYPTKNLGAIGDAGALTTGDAELAERARVLRNYGQTVRYHHSVLGMNSRLDEAQAAILRVRLGYLSCWIDARRAIARRYYERIRNPHVRVLPLPVDTERHAHHLFVVTTSQRDALQAFLKGVGVESLIHYPVPIHAQSPCRDLQRDPQGLTRTEAHANTCLSLPCHPGLNPEAVDSVIDAVNRFPG
jgi:dTDP-4-amino-4,6-dideoxygalactose transaminase